MLWLEWNGSCSKELIREGNNQEDKGNTMFQIVTWHAIFGGGMS